MRSVASIGLRRGLLLFPFRLLLTLFLATPAFCQSLAPSAGRVPSARLSSALPAVAPGTYSGLFYESSHVAQGHSGFITLTVTPAGHFTGRLLVGSERYIGQGQFTTGTPLTTSLWRHDGKVLVVTLQATPVPDAEGLTGSVSSGLWTADLCADRAVFNAQTNPAPYAGTYTLVIPGSETNTVHSTGDGCGSLKVDAAGNVSFIGTLTDGAVVAQKAPLSKRGEWPFYVALYGGKGSLLSWLTFTNQPTDDVHGALSWLRPSSPRNKPFSGRFTSGIFQACGSRYLPPVGTNLVLNLTNGVLVFSGPTSLGAPFTNAIRLATRQKVVSADSSGRKLALVQKLPTGAFSGTVALPGSSARLAFKGVVLQKQNAGAGYFLHKGQSGRVCLTERRED